jgi:hypothetical protein
MGAGHTFPFDTFVSMYTCNLHVGPDITEPELNDSAFISATGGLDGPPV